MAGSLPKTIKQSNDPPLSRGYTLGSGEDSLELKELMANCTQLVCFVRKKNREICLELILLGTTLSTARQVLLLLDEVSTVRLKISTARPNLVLLSDQLIQPTHEAEETASMPHYSPLHDVHLHGSAEGSVQQHDLTVLVTKLNDRIDGLEKDLQQTKKTYSTALTKLVLRVKKLEYKLKSGKARRKLKIVLFDDEEFTEDSSSE
ncbi:hypothetical protein Tco_1142038 [Tanacetum coccineum]